MERDLPIALQNVTTHILRHMVEGIAKFGPLYTTWMFPFERMNSWFTRRVLNRQYPESTIMETYQIYCWVMYCVFSKKFGKEDANFEDLEKEIMDRDELVEQEIVESKSLFKLPDTQMQGLIQHYNNESILNVAIRLTRVQLNTCFTNITYVSSKSGDRVSIFVYCIKDECYGEIISIFKHTHNTKHNIFLSSICCQNTLLTTKHPCTKFGFQMDTSKNKLSSRRLMRANRW